MKERKNIFKRIGYLLMIITLTIVAFLAPKFIEKEINASEGPVPIVAPDKEAPVIEIEGYELKNGKTEIWVQKEDALRWTPPTATVTDNLDTGLVATETYFKGDGTTSINLKAARVELITRKYIIVRYNVSDAAGNAAKEVSAIFSITDKLVPVINPVVGGEVNTEDALNWTAPSTTAQDNKDGDISDNIVITYFKKDQTTPLVDLDAARQELVAGRNIVVKYNVSDAAGNAADEVIATFRAKKIGLTTIMTGNWTLTQQYAFTTNEAIVSYSLDGGNFIAIGPRVGGKYHIDIGNKFSHQLQFKNFKGNISETFPIQVILKNNDNLMFYASKGLLPWDNDSNWEYGGTGSITPNILDADGNCKQEYGEGAACYKIYELDVDGKQVKVLQQLDDSSTAILQTVRLLDRDDYNNLYRNGGAVRGRVILPAQDTYAGIGDPNTQNYAGNSQAVGYGAFVGLQFEAGKIPGSNTNRRYGLNITYSGEYVKIVTTEGSKVLNGKQDVAKGSSKSVYLPEVKIGDSLDFELHIPKSTGPIGILPKAAIYVNGIYVGQTNFNPGGSSDNKVIISSGSTKGTNRAILIENFGSVINTRTYDVTAPTFGGNGVVNNPIYTFESNENITGYKLNGDKWVSITPSFKIDDILLRKGGNNFIVRDIAGNIAIYTVYYLVEKNINEEDFEPTPYVPVIEVEDMVMPYPRWKSRWR